MYRNFSFIFLFAYLLGLCSLRAQTPVMWHYGEEEGLPGIKVFDLFQDTEGFIWIGTDFGLVRYDGYEFRLYDHPAHHRQSLTRIQEDDQGRIWTQSFYGRIFYVEDDTLRLFEPWEEHAKDTEFERFIVDSQNRVWIMGKKVHPPKIYDLNSKTWSSLELPAEDVEFNWMIQHSDERFFITAPQGSWTITDEGMAPMPLPYETTDISLGISQTQFGTTFFFDRSQNVPGLYIFQEPGEFRTIYLPNEDKIFQTRNLTIRGSSHKEYFFLTGKGVYVYDSTFTPMFGGKPLLENMQTNDFLQDREGNYWISTKRSGIFVFPSVDNFFFDTNNSNLPDNRISTLEKTIDGKLLMGFQDGSACIYVPEKDEMTSFIVNEERTKEVKTILHDPVNHLIWATAAQDLIAFDSTGRKIMAGATGGGEALQLYHGNLLRAGPYRADVYAMYPTYGAVPPLSQAYRERYTYQPATPTSLPHLVLREHRAFSIFGDTIHNQIWVGFADGLSYFDEEKETKVFLKDTIRIIVREMDQTADGLIWAGTPSQGVLGLQDGKVIHHFHKGNILPSNDCRWLEVDGNQLWIGSDIGVFLIDPATESVWIHGKQDAIPSHDIRELTHIGDRVYVATPKGMNSFLKKEMKASGPGYPTFITSTALFEKDTLLQEGIHLAYNQNYLRFGFLGLAYRPQGNFQYKYRMLGLDSSWVAIPSSQRYARYPSMPAGTYTFEVITVVEGDSADPIPATFSFSIGLPIWQRWWFWTLISLGLIGLTSFGFLLRIRNLKERNRVDQQLRIAQLSAIKSQMNPHFIFNALNSIQDFILLNEKRQANSYLGKFSDLMRLYLNMSNQNVVFLSDVIRALELYLQLEGIRFDDTFNYIMDIHEDIDPEIIQIPAMVIQPYVENAIKHGLLHKKENRLLLIRFELEAEDLLYCEIRDNGVGRKRAAEIKARNPIKRKSFATLATEKRLDLLNYGRDDLIGVEILDLYDQRNNPSGTQVSIRIPLKISLEI